MRLPADSINTWADFKSVFLAEFFPSSKTSALKRKISCIRQEYDETLSEYWEKYMSLLESCPNHRMKEIEVHHTFYEGMNKETKDLANSSSGGDFTQLRVGEAKKVFCKLLNAKKTYDNARDGYSRESVASASATDQEERMDLKMEELKKELLTAIKQNTPPPSPTVGKEAPELPYDQPDNSLDVEQANAAGMQDTTIPTAIGFRESRGMHRGGTTKISDGEMEIRIRTKIRLQINPTPTRTKIPTVT